MEILTWIMENLPEIFSGVVALLTGIIAICLLIPGEQPEKTLQIIVDFLKKLSLK